MDKNELIHNENYFRLALASLFFAQPYPLVSEKRISVKLSGIDAAVGKLTLI
jgi:hypothetical protein